MIQKKFFARFACNFIYRPPVQKHLLTPLNNGKLLPPPYFDTRSLIIYLEIQTQLCHCMHDLPIINCLEEEGLF